MGIYQRKDSPYWWMIVGRGRARRMLSTGIPVDGGTQVQTRDNRKLAQAAYAAAMGDLARERFGLLAVTRPAMLFSAYATWYQEHYSQHKRNAVREASMLRQLGRTFDALQLSEITRERVLEWHTARATEVGPATVNREIDILQHMLGTAVPKYLSANPAARIPDLRVPERDLRLLAPEEERRLLELADPEWQAIIICALDTLQRLSSVAGLQREQDHGTWIAVLNPKTRGYKVPVSKRLRTALDALPSNGAHCFPSVQGGTVAARRKRLSDAFAELCRRATVPYGRPHGITFHALRHTGASRMLSRGVDIKTVQELGGWADLAILQRYLHPTDPGRRAAVEAVSCSAPVTRPQKRLKTLGKS
jgi:integrase